MGKMMRFPNVFEKCHNLMLVLFMIKFSAVALAYQSAWAFECVLAGTGWKMVKKAKTRIPKARLTVAMN